MLRVAKGILFKYISAKHGNTFIQMYNYSSYKLVSTGVYKSSTFLDWITCSLWHDYTKQILLFCKYVSELSSLVHKYLLFRTIKVAVTAVKHVITISFI